MKHLLFFIIAALCSLTATAQDATYHPFCEEEKLWTVDYDWHWVMGNFFQEKHRLEGDTLIAGQTCKKMYCKPYSQDVYHYTGAFYDDGPRVMYFAPGSAEARLVYDFSLQVGDEVEVWPIGGSGNCTLQVKEVGSRAYDGRTFRTLYLEGRVPAGFPDEGENLYATWIEGVGGDGSPAVNVDEKWSNMGGMYTVGLRCCAVGSDMLYFDEPDRITKGEYWAHDYTDKSYVYVPFAEEGKRWAVRCKGNEPDAEEYVKEYVIQGDTIIGGQAAKRMYEDGQYCGAFFDRSHHTYFIAPDTTTPHLYYNFCASCSYGDSDCTRVWHNGAYAQLYACTCCDCASFDNHLLQRTHLDFVAFEGRDADYNAVYCITNCDIRDNYRVEWIEGIGSLAGPIQNWEYPDLDGAPGSRLIACWSPDAIYYETDDYVTKRKLEEQQAQCRVWREGSTWEYYDEDGRLAESYALEAYTKRDGTYYMPLVKNNDAIIGYIRTERGDSLVYARGFNASNGMLLPEVLLYDFTKSYEAGDVMRLGAAKSQSGSTGVDELRIEANDDAPLTFFYDVFEDGDCIPQWNGFIYKVGCLEGPMAYFYNQVSDKKPSAKNLSHLIFGNKKKRGAPTKFFPFGNAYNIFAFDFFNQLAETSDADDAGGNVVASPLSAQFALSMLQNGAAGNTLKEMQFSLGTSAYTLDEVNAYNRSLIDKLQQPVVLSDEYRKDWYWINEDLKEAGLPVIDVDGLIPQIEVANGIWTAPWLPVNEAFFATNAANYDAAAETADFSQQSTLDAIDEWVSEKTHGTIPSINEAPNDEIAMMLINTLFFQGSWEEPFDLKDEKPFTNADGSRVLVKTMFSDEDKERAETDNFKMVRVVYAPYYDIYDIGKEQTKYYMGLYLPKYDDAVLTTAEWQRLGADAVRGRTELTMPRFQVAQELQLDEVLKAMGMRDAFDKRHADFSALSSSLGETCISKVKQLCNITVDERGTTAAAASIVPYVIVGVDHRVLFEMKIDRSFYFTIETSDGDLLFIGRVSHLDGSPAPDGIVLPTSDPDNLKTSTYDLSGRPVAGSRPGVYVVGGKKVVK